MYTNCYYVNVTVIISGLISDAFHMFFDCTGLVAGLAASLISKWRANERYSYGYARAEVVAGFVNGLFLLFIAFFIMSEAVERAIEPPEVSFFSFNLNRCAKIIFMYGEDGLSCRISLALLCVHN